jgi:hypothetical protein
MLSVNSETDGIVVSEASPEDISVVTTLCEHSGATSGVLISDVGSLSFFMIFKLLFNSLLQLSCFSLIYDIA